MGIKYFSSSTTIKNKILKEGINNISFEVIKDNFSSWKEAYDEEQFLIFQNWSNELLLNKSCYFGKKDFGVISDDAKKRISKKSNNMWKKDDIRDKIIKSQKKSWTTERKQNQIIRLKNEFWTVDRKKEHSEKMKGHIGSKKLKGIPKPEGFGKKISDKLKNKPKSQEHKEKLSKARQGKTYPNNRKLSSKIILEIYNKLINGEKCKKIKEDYNLSISMVYRIKKGDIRP